MGKHVPPPGFYCRKEDLNGATIFTFSREDGHSEFAVTFPHLKMLATRSNIFKILCGPHKHVGGQRLPICNLISTGNNSFVFLVFE